MTEAVETQQPTSQLSEKNQQIMSLVETLSVLELADLVKAMEEKFGVSASAPMMVAGGAAAGGAGDAAAEKKDSFSVILTETGANKIQVIKEIRGVTTLGLKEAKDLVDSAPKAIKENVPTKDAEAMKKALEAAGAKVELK